MQDCAFYLFQYQVFYIKYVISVSLSLKRSDRNTKGQIHGSFNSKYVLFQIREKDRKYPFQTTWTVVFFCSLEPPPPPQMTEMTVFQQHTAPQMVFC